MLNLFCVPRNLFSSAGCVASDTALLCLCVCISVLCPSHFCVKRPFFPLPRCCMVWNPGTPPDLVDRTAALVVGADLALPSIKVLRPHLLRFDCSMPIGITSFVFSPPSSHPGPFLSSSVLNFGMWRPSQFFRSPSHIS